MSASSKTAMRPFQVPRILFTAIAVLVLAVVLSRGLGRVHAVTHSTIRQASGITVGPVIVVSRANPTIDHSEMLASIDRANPQRMLACTNAFRPASNYFTAIVYFSDNGGATWSPTHEDTGSVLVADPTCTHGVGDTAWYASNALFDLRQSAATGPISKDAKRQQWSPRTAMSTNVYRSTNAGRTWQFLTRRPAIGDRPYVTVDQTNGPYRGRLYLYAWDVTGDPYGDRKGATVKLAHLASGGLTELIGFAGAGRFYEALPGPGVITVGSVLVIPFVTRLSGGEVGVTTSRDGGRTLTVPVIVGGIKGCPGTSTLIPSTAADESDGPFRGRAYVAWSDGTSGRCLISVAYSSDEGKTWSRPLVLGDAPHRIASATGPHQLQPSIAVNKDGVIGLSWYDTRDDPTDRAYNVRFTASYDGGESFQPSIAVSHDSFDGGRVSTFWAPPSMGGRTIHAGPGDGQRIRTTLQHGNFDGTLPGDTRAMVVGTDGVFHPFWFSNPNRISGLYTAAIKTPGRAYVHGDPSLDGLDDVSALVTLHYTSTAFDLENRVITLMAAVVNRSDTTITTPIKVRLLSLASTAGIPRSTNAVNGSEGRGAIFDFSSALDGKRLGPWSESRPIALTFAIESLDASRIQNPVLDFEGRVFGHAHVTAARDSTLTAGSAARTLPR